MEPETTFYSIILLLGAAHGLFLALALVNIKGGNAIAHRLLALLTLTFAADLAVDFLMESRYLVKYPRLIFIESVSNFLYGPLAYLYTIALTSKEGFRFSVKKWLHFLPFVISIVLLIPFYNLSDEYLLELIYTEADVDDRIGLWVIGGLVVELLPIPLIGVYLTLAVRELNRHGRSIRDQFSSIDRISLVWLRNLLIALCTLYVFYFIAVIMPSIFGDSDQVDAFMSITIVIVIYTIGYMGIRQPVIFSAYSGKSRSMDTRSEDSGERPPAAEKIKYQKSALDAELSKTLLQELQRYMVAERPFLDSALTLTKLADQLGISSNYLSQVINEQTGSNFFDYINQQRVDVAKQLLADPAQADSSILRIAMDAGFNSKSAFYSAFRKHANQTPSQFRKTVSTS